MIQKMEPKLDVHAVLRRHLKPDAPIDPGQEGEEMRIRYDEIRITTPEGDVMRWAGHKPGSIGLYWKGELVASMDMGSTRPGDVFSLTGVTGGVPVRFA